MRQSKCQSSSIIETSKAGLESTEFGHSIHMSLQFRCFNAGFDHQASGSGFSGCQKTDKDGTSNIKIDEAAKYFEDR